MNRDLLTILACPQCHDGLSLDGGREGDREIESGILRCSRCAAAYPIVRGVPRFVPAENYSSNFGLQWNRFRRTQLDSATGLPISRTRFFAESGWTPDELRGRSVLDAGCGAGRFSEIALSCGARVVAVDYSSAVDACRSNLEHYPNLSVVQADIYALPFAPGQFDFVYSLGVLQHTPDPKRALLTLPSQLRPGGKLTADFYLLNMAHWCHPRTWLRPVTTRISPPRLLELVNRSVPILLSVSRFFGRIPVGGRVLKRLVPVADYDGVFGLSEEQRREWALLDTFDWLGARYEYPQRPSTVRRWLMEAGLESIEVFRSHHLAARAVRPVPRTA
jgi:SAM-dependent methyltransferase